jgi:hypothetical protein
MYAKIEFSRLARRRVIWVPGYFGHHSSMQHQQCTYSSLLIRMAAQIARRGRCKNAHSSPFHIFAVGEPTETHAE